ncbi:hypothetical protein ACGC1H_007436 [Rhizoctonia solani]
MQAQSQKELQETLVVEPSQHRCPSDLKISFYYCYLASSPIFLYFWHVGILCNQKQRQRYWRDLFTSSALNGGSASEAELAVQIVSLVNGWVAIHPRSSLICITP